jgi:protein TonB
MGLLQPASATARRVGGRGVIIAAILGLHGLGLAVLTHVKVSVPAAEVSRPIHATLLEANQPLPEPPRLEPQLNVPEIQIPPLLLALEPAALTATVSVAAHNGPRTAAPSTTPASFEGDLPVELERVDYLHRVEPRYPPAAKRARAQGTVFLRVIIDTDGRPREVHVERSSGYEILDMAACRAVEKWLFRPYRENGVARAVSVIVPIEFAITARKGSRKG